MDYDDDTNDDTRYSKEERLQKVLKILRDGRISLVDFILDILDPQNDEFSTYQTRFFSNRSGKLEKLLDRMFEDQRGRTVLFLYAVKLVSNKIAKVDGLLRPELPHTTAGHQSNVLERFFIMFEQAKFSFH